MARVADGKDAKSVEWSDAPEVQTESLQLPVQMICLALTDVQRQANERHLVQDDINVLHRLSRGLDSLVKGASGELQTSLSAPTLEFTVSEKWLNSPSRHRHRHKHNQHYPHTRTANPLPIPTTTTSSRYLKKKFGERETDGPGAPKLGHLSVTTLCEQHFREVKKKSSLASIVVDGEPKTHSFQTYSSGTVPFCHSEVTGKNISEIKKQLRDLFQEIDQDGSGSISTEELRQALKAVGVPQARVQVLLRSSDYDGSGNIDMEEWERVVQSADHEMRRIGEALLEKKRDKGHIFEQEVSKRYWCMMKHNARTRLVWDMIMIVLLAYIAVMVPFNAGFTMNQEGPVDKTLQLIVDILFCVDVAINFRTGYLDDNGHEVLDWKKVAVQYFRTWFLLDFSSSIPLDRFTAGQVRNVQPLKILKVSKVARVFKVMQRARTVWTLDIVQDFVEESGARQFLRRSMIVFRMAIVCHWMACFMALSGPGYLSSYSQVVGPAAWQQYLAALYWAMTTMTTVGYGDITPTTDTERAYAILAMVIGGSFYGYVVGSISAIIANHDLNANAYYEKMDLIMAWLQHHQFPKSIRRRMCHYFENYLPEKTALSAAEIVMELTPDLQQEVCEFLLHEDIRHNPIFDGLTIHEMARIVHLPQRASVEQGTQIVCAGDVGTAMFVLSQGTCTKEFKNSDSQELKLEILHPGDSFGELILLGMEEYWTCTVTAQSRVYMFMIAEDGFLACFENMPEVKQKLTMNVKARLMLAGDDSGAEQLDDAAVDAEKTYCHDHTRNLSGSDSTMTWSRELSLLSLPDAERTKSLSTVTPALPSLQPPGLEVWLADSEQVVVTVDSHSNGRVEKGANPPCDANNVQENKSTWAPKVPPIEGLRQGGKGHPNSDGLPLRAPHPKVQTEDEGTQHTIV